MVNIETTWFIQALAQWLRAPADSIACAPGLNPVSLEDALERNRLLPFFQRMPIAFPVTPEWARFRERLDCAYQHSLLQGLQQVKSGQFLMDTLTRAGIKSLAIRGPFLAGDVYGDPALRLSSDVDILVSHQDRRRAWKACQAAGYQSLDWECPLWPLDHHRIHWRLQREGDPVVCELHWAVEPIYGVMTLDYEALVRDSTPTRQFLLLCLHAWEHVRDAQPDPRRLDETIPLASEETVQQGMLFRWLDVAMFLRKYNRDIDWDWIDRQAPDRRVSSSLVLCLKGVRDWFGLSLPDEVGSFLLKWEKSAERQRSVGLRHRLEVWWEQRSSRAGGLETSLADVLYYLVPHAAFFEPSRGVPLMIKRVGHSLKAVFVLSWGLTSYACFTMITSIRRIAATERASRIQERASLNMGGELRHGDLPRVEQGGHL